METKKFYRVPRNLTTDPYNKRGQDGFEIKRQGDDITLQFADGSTGLYDEFALIEHEDSHNTDFLFQSQPGIILALIAQGKIDPVEAAKRELKMRGYNEKLEFVGFKN